MGPIEEDFDMKVNVIERYWHGKIKESPGKLTNSSFSNLELIHWLALSNRGIDIELIHFHLETENTVNQIRFHKLTESIYEKLMTDKEDEVARDEIQAWFYVYSHSKTAFNHVKNLNRAIWLLQNTDRGEIQEQLANFIESTVSEVCDQSIRESSVQWDEVESILRKKQALYSQLEFSDLISLLALKKGKEKRYQEKTNRMAKRLVGLILLDAEYTWALTTPSPKSLSMLRSDSFSRNYTDYHKAMFEQQIWYKECELLDSMLSEREDGVGANAINQFDEYSAPNQFVKMNGIWRVRFRGGRVVMLPHLNGMSIIQQVLRCPSQEIPILQIMSGHSTVETGNIDENSEGDTTDNAMKGIEQFDAKTERDIRKRIDELEKSKSVLEQVSSFESVDKIDEISYEIKMLTLALKSKAHYTGDIRKAASDNARKQVGLAKKNIKSDDPTLFEFLTKYVKVGYNCLYAPPDSEDIQWILD